jgi:hypothetical protein
MSDSRKSPIPQDRVNENVDQAQRAKDAQRERTERERHLKDQGVDERPGKPKADVEPSFPEEPTSRPRAAD